jgi:tRNA nucleotidyltransferase/poly(A) polymerase
MDSLIQSILLKLSSFSTNQNQKLFVVGGTLRDFLLQKPFSDFDLTGKDAAQMGINFSRSLNSKYVHLDKTPGRRTVRVILNQKKHLDFSDLQGRNIAEDLSRRDFTINAMAQPLPDFLSGIKVVIDPHKGQEDLINKKIRVLQGPIISSDPLRMLRAFRFAATLNFEIDANTLTHISLNRTRLKESASERIWHELTLFLKTPDTFPLLKVMNDCGLLDCILPASNQAFIQYQKVESLLKYPEETFPKYANKFGSKNFLNKHYLVKLSVLLMVQNPMSDIHPKKDNTKDYNLQFSNAEKQLLKQAISGAKSMTEMYLSAEFNKNYELIKSLHEELLASAVLFATNSEGPNTEDRAFFCNCLLKFYYDQFLPIVSKKPLLNGEDIIHQFKLSPSPLFGKILNCVQREQVLGKVTTREDAMILAENIIQSQTNESN